MTDSDAPSLFPAAERWAAQLEGWGVPSEILDQAPESPWSHDPNRFDVDETMRRDTVSSRWAREVLPPLGGTVLDVGCGGGRSSLPLVPPATELIGVDTSGAMLDRFVAAAAAAGIARRTVHGDWPDVAGHTPIADVVVCHHVVYNVADILPFVMALTDHARLAVVVELPALHPMSAWSEAWRHFWGVVRPPGPTADAFVAVLRDRGQSARVAVRTGRRLRRVRGDRAASALPARDARRRTRRVARSASADVRGTDGHRPLAGRGRTGRLIRSVVPVG